MVPRFFFLAVGMVLCCALLFAHESELRQRGRSEGSERRALLGLEYQRREQLLRFAIREARAAMCATPALASELKPQLESLNRIEEKLIEGDRLSFEVRRQQSRIETAEKGTLRRTLRFPSDFEEQFFNHPLRITGQVLAELQNVYSLTLYPSEAPKTSRDFNEFSGGMREGFYRSLPENVVRGEVPYSETGESAKDLRLLYVLENLSQSDFPQFVEDAAKTAERFGLLMDQKTLTSAEQAEFSELTAKARVYAEYGRSPLHNYQRYLTDERKAEQKELLKKANSALQTMVTLVARLRDREVFGRTFPTPAELSPRGRETRDRFEAWLSAGSDTGSCAIAPRKTERLPRRLVDRARKAAVRSKLAALADVSDDPIVTNKHAEALSYHLTSDAPPPGKLLRTLNQSYPGDENTYIDSMSERQLRNLDAVVEETARAALPWSPDKMAHALGGLPMKPAVLTALNTLKAPVRWRAFEKSGVESAWWKAAETLLSQAPAELVSAVLDGKNNPANLSPAVLEKLSRLHAAAEPGEKRGELATALTRSAHANVLRLSKIMDEIPLSERAAFEIRRATGIQEPERSFRNSLENEALLRWGYRSPNHSSDAAVPAKVHAQKLARFLVEPTEVVLSRLTVETLLELAEASETPLSRYTEAFALVVPKDKEKDHAEALNVIFQTSPIDEKRIRWAKSAITVLSSLSDESQAEKLHTGAQGLRMGEEGKKLFEALTEMRFGASPSSDSYEELKALRREVPAVEEWIQRKVVGDPMVQILSAAFGLRVEEALGYADRLGGLNPEQALGELVGGRLLPGRGERALRLATAVERQYGALAENRPEFSTTAERASELADALHVFLADARLPSRSPKLNSADLKTHIRTNRTLREGRDNAALLRNFARRPSAPSEGSAPLETVAGILDRQPRLGRKYGAEALLSEMVKVGNVYYLVLEPNSPTLTDNGKLGVRMGETIEEVGTSLEKFHRVPMGKIQGLGTLHQFKIVENPDDRNAATWVAVFGDDKSSWLQKLSGP